MPQRLRDFRADGGAERWQAWTEWPLVGLALVFLFVLILPLAEPTSSGFNRALDVANVSIWALFAGHYLVSVYLALDRRRFVRTHILDLLVVVLPFLRPFRLLRMFAIVSSTTRRMGGRLVQRVTVFAVLTAAIVVATTAVLVFDAEKTAPDRNIKTLGDALWWGMTTVTTIGYGDRYPVTAEGRLLAVVLMLTGIALLGVVTAAVAAWFVNIVRNASTAGTAEAAAVEIDLTEQIADLTSKADDIYAELRALRAQLEAGRG